MKIYIKNMVCQGTRIVLIKELEKLDFKYRSFVGNEIDFGSDLSLKEINLLDRSMDKYGVELTLKKCNLVSKTRYVINELVKNNLTLKTSFSYYVSRKVGYNYTYIDTCFRKETGISVEDYYREKKKVTEQKEELKWSDILNSDS